ncbi:MAG: hypothetical protein ACOYN4_18805 [Bacteroidales bacterium]
MDFKGGSNYVLQFN